MYTNAVNCVFMICVPLQPTLSHAATSNQGRGSFNCLFDTKNSTFDQKRPFFVRFFIKNSKFWFIRMLQLCFTDLCAPLNTIPCEIEGGGFPDPYLKLKNSFDHKTAIIGHVFMKNGPFPCIHML